VVYILVLRVMVMQVFKRKNSLSSFPEVVKSFFKVAVGGATMFILFGFYSIILFHVRFNSTTFIVGNVVEGPYIFLIGLYFARRDFKNYFE